MRSTSIPPLLHQICLGGTISPKLHESLHATAVMNPRWQCELYDEKRAETFIVENYDRAVLRAYDSIDPLYGAARADLLRYLIVYKRGGVYLDIKSRFSGPIDDFVRGDEGYILAQWRNGPGECHQGFGLVRDLTHVPRGEYQTFHIISAPDHPFLEAVIRRVLLNISRYKPWHAVGRTGVLRTTGPIAYTKAIYPLIGKHACKIVKHEGELGLEVSVLDAREYAEIFQHHYSELSIPLVRMGPLRRTVSAAAVTLRKWKAAATG